MRFSTRTRVLVAAATVGGLSLTAGCFVPGGLPPSVVCTDAALIQSQAQLAAVNATIDLKESFLESTPDLPEEIVSATQSAISALQDQAEAIQAQIDSCDEEGGTPTQT